jgi:hypothetical protein
MKDQGQSEYYQAIARDFLRRRGAPLLLSPRDLAVIAGWEADRIPLRVVLEGIARVFDVLRVKGRGTRGVSLAVCDSQVRKAMAQHADRGAGRPRSASLPRSEKAGRARREADRCLRGLAEGDAELRAHLETASRLLAGEPLDEETLEGIDEAVDDLLWRRAPRADRERCAHEATRELAGKSASEIEAATRTRLVKDERRRRRIPYVSLFYY